MEEQKELLATIQGLIDKSQEGVAKKKDIEKEVAELNKAIAKLDNNEMADLKAAVDKMVKANEEMSENLNKTSQELKSLKEGQLKQSEAPKNFRSVVESAIMEKKEGVVTEVTDTYGKRYSLKEFFEKNGSRACTPEFVLKDAVDMLQSNIVGNYVANLQLTELDPNRVGIPLAIYPHVVNVLPKKRIVKPNMAMLVVYSYEDGSATKVEGAASGKSSFLFKTVFFPAFYIATHFTLSDETLDDLQEALDEINLVAPDAINGRIDSKVLSAAGDDVSDIKGLFASTKSTAFVPASYANFAENATIVDLIAAMKLSAEANKYVPDTVWLNPVDVAQIAAMKNLMADSVQDRRIVFGAFGQPVAILGMRINENTNVTADTIAVGKTMNNLLLGIRKDMTMEIGYNGTDFVEGQKTVVIKTRVAFGVRDAKATIYSDGIAADVASISKTVA